jgi:hypothetical protein
MAIGDKHTLNSPGSRTPPKGLSKNSLRASPVGSGPSLPGDSLSEAISAQTVVTLTNCTTVTRPLFSSLMLLLALNNVFDL